MCTSTNMHTQVYSHMVSYTHAPTHTLAQIHLHSLNLTDMDLNTCTLMYAPTHMKSHVFILAYIHPQMHLCFSVRFRRTVGYICLMSSFILHIYLTLSAGIIHLHRLCCQCCQEHVLSCTQTNTHLNMVKHPFAYTHQAVAAHHNLLSTMLKPKEQGETGKSKMGVNGTNSIWRNNLRVFAKENMKENVAVNGIDGQGLFFFQKSVLTFVPSQEC